MAGSGTRFARSGTDSGSVARTHCCGHGRTARGLLGYIRSPGRYYGLDVDGPRISDAQQRIEARWPNFQFIHADVYTRKYNPRGTTQSTDYTFPFENDTFDVIYAASLFSHLLPDETAHYMREAARVLKPRGKCLFSFFMLDNYRGSGTAITPDYVFDHTFPGHDGVAVRFAEYPDNLIGYRRDVMERLAREAGLQVERIVPGLWTENTDWAVNEQDLMVLTRAD